MTTMPCVAACRRGAIIGGRVEAVQLQESPHLMHPIGDGAGPWRCCCALAGMHARQRVSRWQLHACSLTRHPCAAPCREQHGWLVQNPCCHTGFCITGGCARARAHLCWLLTCAQPLLSGSAVCPPQSVHCLPPPAPHPRTLPACSTPPSTGHTTCATPRWCTQVGSCGCPWGFEWLVKELCLKALAGCTSLPCCHHHSCIN